MGNGSQCEGQCFVGACSLSTGDCVEMSEVGCCHMGYDGYYHGDDTLCANIEAPDWGACCLPVGDCETMAEPTCATNGGIWRGEGTVCGDFNNNGIPDTCEEIGTCRSDINEDGQVSTIDLLTLLLDWGPCPEGEAR